MKSNLILPYLLKFRVILLLVIVILIASILRIYKLDSVPPALSWDEAAVGVNAWTIANWGRDEYGKFLPPFFRSFGDDKHPVHIYTTAISVKLLGLSEFSTRLPFALFGVLNVLLIYYLAHLLFKSKLLGLIAALFLTISPYHFHFSRFNHEAVITLTFFLLGLVLFLKSLSGRWFYLPLSVLSLILTFLAYHPSKIIVPITFTLLILLWGKQIFRNIKGVFISVIMLILLVILLVINPQLLGIARINQTSLSNDAIKNTKLYSITHNQLLGRINLVLEQYSWHFYPQYLILSGDKNARLSAQGAGEFYPIDVIFFVFGILYLIYKRSKAGILLFGWAIVAPLPSSLVAESPHAARAMFMMGSFHLIAASGFYFIIQLVRRKVFRILVTLVVLILLVISLQKFLNYYFGEYALRYAIEWQYGMKQIVEYVKEHNEYAQVYVTDARSQPYIFFLYYLKPPLEEYLGTVIYNNSESNRSYNTVSTFSRYYFGGWDPLESFPTPGVLYILTPSQYDGLRHRLAFDVKKVIYYPKGTTAYYLVSAK